MKEKQKKELTREDFEAWLSMMDITIKRFLESFSEKTKTELDFSPASLVIVEQWLLNRYSNIEAIKSENAKIDVDNIARYVGETFRRTLNGKWDINLENPEKAFYKMPLITSFDGMKTPISPYNLVSAAADRRTGKFIKTILENNLKYGKKGN